MLAQSHFSCCTWNVLNMSDNNHSHLLTVHTIYPLLQIHCLTTVIFKHSDSLTSCQSLATEFRDSLCSTSDSRSVYKLKASDTRGKDQFDPALLRSTPMNMQNPLNESLMQPTLVPEQRKEYSHLRDISYAVYTFSDLVSSERYL